MQKGVRGDPTRVPALKSLITPNTTNKTPTGQAAPARAAPSFFLCVSIPWLTFKMKGEKPVGMEFQEINTIEEAVK